MSWRYWITISAAALLGLAVFLLARPANVIDTPVRDSLPPAHSEPAESAAAVSAVPDAVSGAPSSDSDGPGDDCVQVAHHWVTDDGTAIFPYRCADAADQPHPYEAYSDDTLEVMAYSDAEAARLLGLRIYADDPQEAFQWTLRSAALTNSSVPLQNFANAFAPPLRIGDQAILKNYRESFIIAVVADAVGPDTENVARMEPLMREVFPNPDEIMERLRPIAIAHIERMRDIQRDVTGTVSIAEPD